MDALKTGETKHGKTGAPLFVVSLQGGVERGVYDRLAAEAKVAGGYYSGFRGRGAIPGFQFPSAEARQSFIDRVTGAQSLIDSALARARQDADAGDGDFIARLRETRHTTAPAARADDGRSYRIKQDGAGYIAMRMPQERGMPPRYYRSDDGRAWSEDQAIARVLEEVERGGESFSLDGTADPVARLAGDELGPRNMPITLLRDHLAGSGRREQSRPAWTA